MCYSNRTSWLPAQWHSRSPSHTTCTAGRHRELVYCPYSRPLVLCRYCTLSYITSPRPCWHQGSQGYNFPCSKQSIGKRAARHAGSRKSVSYHHHSPSSPAYAPGNCASKDPFFVLQTIRSGMLFHSQTIGMDRWERQCWLRSRLFP